VSGFRIFKSLFGAPVEVEDGSKNDSAKGLTEHKAKPYLCDVLGIEEPPGEGPGDERQELLEGGGQRLRERVEDEEQVEEAVVADHGLTALGHL
jgi:hypothetical protein